MKCNVLNDIPSRWKLTPGFIGYIGCVNFESSLLLCPNTIDKHRLNMGIDKWRKLGLVTHQHSILKQVKTWSNFFTQYSYVKYQQQTFWSMSKPLIQNQVKYVKTGKFSKTSELPLGKWGQVLRKDKHGLFR